MLTSMACKSSVKAGQELNMWQMEELISRWKTTNNPYTCPHGRPIEIKMSKKQIFRPNHTNSHFFHCFSLQRNM